MGADRAEISALFSVEKLPEAQAWLDRAALLEGHECLIRRTVTADGRSRAFINGSPATLAQCKELGELLVDLLRLRPRLPAENRRPDLADGGVL